MSGIVSEISERLRLDVYLSSAALLLLLLLLVVTGQTDVGVLPPSTLRMSAGIYTSLCTYTYF